MAIWWQWQQQSLMKKGRKDVEELSAWILYYFAPLSSGSRGSSSRSTITTTPPLNRVQHLTYWQHPMMVYWKYKIFRQGFRYVLAKSLFLFVLSIQQPSCLLLLLYYCCIRTYVSPSPKKHAMELYLDSFLSHSALPPKFIAKNVFIIELIVLTGWWRWWTTAGGQSVTHTCIHTGRQRNQQTLYPLHCKKEVESSVDRARMEWTPVKINRIFAAAFQDSNSLFSSALSLRRKREWIWIMFFSYGRHHQR